MNPIAFNLSKLDWDFFGTLTFRKIPSRAIQKAIIFHFLREVGRMYETSNWKWDLLWAVRHEFGEKTGRPHFHFLLKTKNKNAHWTNFISEQAMLKSIWEVNCNGKQENGSAGFADIRNYDPSKTGAEYIMKADVGFLTSKANQYELHKFYLDNLQNLDGLSLLVAPSVLWELTKRKSGRSGTDRRYNRESLARFLRSLKSEKTKSRNHRGDSVSGSPERFLHPHAPRWRM